MAIRVRTIGVGPGASADLTDAVAGLSWSSANPGGDERCTFTLKRQWFSGAPEIAQGNLLYVEDGPNRLWSGRVEENNRSVSDSESIGVTAYGLGIRLKDDTSYMQIFVDRDTSKFGAMPANRRIAHGNTITVDQDYHVSTDAGGLQFQGVDAKAITIASRAEAWYTAPTGLTIAKLQYIGTEGNVTNEDAATFYLGPDDALAASTSTTLTLDGTLRTATPATPARYAVFQARAASTHTPAAAAGFRRTYTKIALYGNHGLTTRAIDSSTPDGLYGGDIVGSLLSGVTGITASRVDAPTTVIPHFVLDEPVAREDGIRAINQFFGYDWGTFGATSVLDTSTTGYFCWKAPDTATAHWTLRRAECDDIGLNVELATLYNAVIVTYTDPATTGTQTVTRTTTVQALNDAGLTRTARLDGGVLTLAGAQTLGDKFLELAGQVPPARGSVTVSGSVPHYQRGSLPCHFMRADGSNLRLSDVLPSKDALSLATTQDRRTLFPVSRVEVDCSGRAPRTTIEVDQARDTLSILQARLALAASFPNGLPA